MEPNLANDHADGNEAYLHAVETRSRLDDPAARVDEARSSRRRRDFVRAARLAESSFHGLSGPALAEAACEAALAHARLDSLARLQFPSKPHDRLATVGRLATSEHLLDVALRSDPDCAAAWLLTGVLAYCRGDDRRAVECLDHVDGRLDAEIGIESCLFLKVRFHRSLARLQLLDADMTFAEYEEILEVLAAGYQPSPEALVAACHALAAHGSPHASDLAGDVAGIIPVDVSIAELLVSAARGGHKRAANVARNVAHRRSLPPDTRFELVSAALAGAELASEWPAVEEIADEVEALLRSLQHSLLDERWSEVLATDHVLRDVIGPANADLARVSVLRRIGRIGDAMDAALGLFYRAAEGGALDPHDLLGLLAELGMDEANLLQLRRLVPRPDVTAETHGSLASQVRVLFVGGDETQQRYRGNISAALRDRYAGQVVVDWVDAGWSSNWVKALKQATARYPSHDVLVVMSFLRTMLGQRLRRSAGEAGLPWVACTGHGRAAIECAIDRAVVVARSANG